MCLCNTALTLTEYILLAEPIDHITNMVIYHIQQTRGPKWYIESVKLHIDYFRWFVDISVINFEWLKFILKPIFSRLQFIWIPKFHQVIVHANNKCMYVTYRYFEAHRCVNSWYLKSTHNITVGSDRLVLYHLFHTYWWNGRWFRFIHVII